MTVHAILGLTALNLWLLVAGLAVLFGLRGWSDWAELARLLGLAYLTGVASLGIVWSYQLILGIDMSLASIFVSGLLVVVVGVLAGIRAGRRLPPWRARLRPSLTSGFFAALAVIYLEAEFRAGRLAGLYEFDAWSFWVPKAKAIFYFGGLDHQFFHDLPGPSYPPLVPVLEASSFHFMGRTDEITLHLQFWFLLVGFVWAAVGVIRGRVVPLLLWPPILLVLVTPEVVGHALDPEGDFLLDVLFALSVLLLALRVREPQAWPLGLVSILLAAAVLTKREGLVLAACALLAAFVAMWPQRRSAYPGLALVALLTGLAIVPWRVLLFVRDLPGGGPEAGGTGLFDNLDRAWPSLRLALSTLFDFHIWLIVVSILVLAILVAGAGGDRQLAVYAGALSVLCLAAFTWSTWAFPSLPITKTQSMNPIVRFSGALVVAAGGLIPLLLARSQPNRRRA
jgi:hypothetical protein